MAKSKGKAGRGSFLTSTGVVLASAGSAVGLGNIWRFPMEAGRNGGAAFILVYVLFVFAVALPVMVSEFVIGRASKANAFDAYRVLAPKSPWKFAGVIGVVGGFLVLSYYSVVAGWTLKYTCDAVKVSLFNGAGEAERFNGFIANPWQPICFQAVFLMLTHFVVERGVERGIERFSKMLMPLLFLIMCVLLVISARLPGAADGLKFLLRPDWGKVSPSVILSAVGQAFFSLSVGIGCLVTYGSYFGAQTRIVRSAFGVCLVDTLVAVMSGFIIFPAVFSAGVVAVDAGPGLVFIALPSVIQSAFNGSEFVQWAFSGLFYMLLALAALTSTISMHEMSTAFVGEHFGLSRRASAWTVTGICMTLGALCSLSFGALSGAKVLGLGCFDLFDFLTAKLLMPVGGILILVFCGWRLGRRLVNGELTNGGSVRVVGLKILMVLVRWVAPIGVLAVLVNQLIG